METGSSYWSHISRSDGVSLSRCRSASSGRIFMGGSSRTAGDPSCFQGYNKAKGHIASDLQNQLCPKPTGSPDAVLLLIASGGNRDPQKGRNLTLSPPGLLGRTATLFKGAFIPGLPRCLAARTPWRGKKNFKCILRTTSILLLCREGAHTQRPSQEERFDLLGRIHFPWWRLLELKLWYEVRLV